MIRCRQITWLMLTLLTLAGCGLATTEPTLSELPVVESLTTNRIESPSESADASEKAMAAVDDFYAAFNDGDINGAIARLEGPPDAYRIRGEDDAFERFILTSGRQDTTRYLVWLMAQGSTVTNRKCTVDEDPQAMVVACQVRARHGVRDALGVRPLENEVTFDVVEGRIVGLDELRRLRRDGAADDFDKWVRLNYPDDADLAQSRVWSSDAEAIEAGQARVKHLREYAAYLQENTGEEASS